MKLRPPPSQLTRPGRSGERGSAVFLVLMLLCIMAALNASNHLALRATKQTLDHLEKQQRQRLARQVILTNAISLPTLAMPIHSLPSPPNTQMQTNSQKSVDNGQLRN